jgi:hypothetical protein
MLQPDFSSAIVATVTPLPPVQDLKDDIGGMVLPEVSNFSLSLLSVMLGVMLINALRNK